MAEINVRKRGRRWEYYFEVARVKGKRKRFSKGGFTARQMLLVQEQRL